MLKIPFYKWKSDEKYVHGPTVQSFAEYSTQHMPLTSPSQSLHLCCGLFCHVPSYFCCTLPSPSALLFLLSLVACFCFFPSVSRWRPIYSAVLRVLYLRLQFLWSKSHSLSSQPPVYTQSILLAVETMRIN